MSPIEQAIQRLPLELQKEVEDFIAFLQERLHKKGSQRPKFGWAGSLKHLRNHFTSVELQHKIRDFRGRS